MFRLNVIQFSFRAANVVYQEFDAGDLFFFKIIRMLFEGIQEVMPHYQKNSIILFTVSFSLLNTGDI